MYSKCWRFFKSSKNSSTLESYKFSLIWHKNYDITTSIYAFVRRSFNLDSQLMNTIAIFIKEASVSSAW